MKETKTNHPQDIFLVFRDMLLYVLLRWRSILVVALALAVLAGGYKYLQDTRRYQAAVQNQAGEMEPKELDASSMAKVTAVLRYRSAYEGACAYNEAALLMHIDPEAVPTRNISYLITGDRAYAAAELYSKYLADENMYTAITGQLTNAKNPLPVYLAELITTSISQDEAPSAPAGATVCRLLNIRIVAPTEELCGQIATAIKERMTTLSGTIRESMGTALTCEAVYDQYGVLRTPTIRDQQQKNLNTQNDLETKLAEAEEALSAEERTYIEQQSAVEGGTSLAPAKPSVSKKFLVLGFLAGGVLMAFLYVLRYIFTRRVQSRTDMAIRYPFPVFGAVALGGKKGFFIDRWLKAWLRDKAEPVDLVQRQVVLAARCAEVKQVYATGCALSADAATLAGLEAALAEQGITLTVGAYPTTDVAAMDAMAAADALLLVETVDVSSHNELARVLALADQCGQTVLGAVLMQ
ncbi:MAG: hypothetical protein IJ518_01180 [Clostridia bacterium]|nr:hypothetical protein [Clostridia bacterium]